MDRARLQDLPREELISLLEDRVEGGINVSFSGKASVRRMARKVRPRVTRNRPKYSDFLFWKDDTVIAIDTTGGHLLLEKTGRKPLSISPSRGDNRRIIIRLVSDDKYNSDVVLEGEGGFTLWDRKQDGLIQVRYQPDVESIVALALRV